MILSTSQKPCRTELRAYKPDLCGIQGCIEWRNEVGGWRIEWSPYPFSGCAMRIAAASCIASRSEIIWAYAAPSGLPDIRSHL